MSEFVASLVGGLVAGGFALAGVRLAGVSQAETQREALREASLSSQRQLIVNVIVAGREWADHQSIYLPILQLMAKAPTDDLLEFADTDTAKRTGALSEALRQALTSARLFLVHQPLRDAARDLTAFIDGFVEEVNGPIFKDPHDPALVGTGLAQVGKFRSDLAAMEDLAVKHLRGVLWTDSEA